MIYARVDNAVAGNFCHVVVPFEIIVNPAPELNPNGAPFAYNLCEDDITSPGIATLYSFQDITNNLWDLTNGNSSTNIPLLNPNSSNPQVLDDFMVSYHLNEQDAEDGENALSPGYQVNDGEVLFIRIEDINTGCFNTNAIAQVQINVEPSPEIVTSNPDDIRICADDVDNPFQASIDLTQFDETINIGSSENNLVIYYEGMANYNDGIPIDDVSNYNVTESPQRIFAEVVNTQTLCESSSFVNFQIIVNPLPNIPGLEEATICVDENGNLIDDENAIPEIDTGLSADNYSFEWQLDGNLLTETTPSINATEPGTYSVTVTQNNSGCTATKSTTVAESQTLNFDIEILTPIFSDNHIVEVINILGSGNFIFQLDDGEWISAENGQTSFVFNNVMPGTHIIRGIDENGCGEKEIVFTVLDYPPISSHPMKMDLMIPGILIV